jgi:hypothetical protein
MWNFIFPLFFLTLCDSVKTKHEFDLFFVSPPPPQIVSFVYVSYIVSIVMFLGCFESEDRCLMPMWFIRCDVNFYIHMHGFALHLSFLWTSIFGCKNLLFLHFPFWCCVCCDPSISVGHIHLVNYILQVCCPHTDLYVWFYFCLLCQDRDSCPNFRISVSQHRCPVFVSTLVCVFILHVFQNNLYLWLF